MTYSDAVTVSETAARHPVGSLPAWGNGIVIAIGAIGALVAAGLDLLLANDAWHLVLMAVTGLVMSGGLVLSWWAPVPGAVLAMAASVGGSIVVGLSASTQPIYSIDPFVYESFFSYTPGAYESFVLIALAYIVVMRAAPLWAGVTVVGLVITSVFSWGIALQTQPILWTFAPIPVLIAAGIAGMIRFGTWQRGRDVADARFVERLDLARELHDVIAHHMTGIVIQAQAGQLVAKEDPDKALELFGTIELAGAGALSSMRQLVSNLRDVEVVPPPVDAAAEISQMADTLGMDGVAVDVELAPFPAELGPTLVRLTREALTNVARHSSGVTRVAVSVIDEGNDLRWSVTDDGAVPAQPKSSDTGFGLVGMRERVEALGGTFTAEFGDTGWSVTARIPKRVDRG